MKNLMLQNSLIEQLNQNLDGADFKDFILKLNDYFLNGVVPEFDGIKKVLFDMSKPYYDYLSSKYATKMKENGNFGFDNEKNNDGNFVGVLSNGKY